MMSMSRERFLREYELDLNLEFEFEKNGEPANWAPNHAGSKFWGSEDASIVLDVEPNKGNTESSAIAISPDEKHIAVATNAVIRGYNLKSRQMQAELIGHQSNVHSLYFAPRVDAQNASYILFSGGSRVGGGEGQVIVWYLDEQGRQIGGRMPFAVESLTDMAMDAMRPSLAEHHLLAESAVHDLRVSISEALMVADVRNRAIDLPLFDGRFPGFGTSPVSHDGKHFLYVAHGDNTQRGIRPADELPQIVVVDIAVPSIERCRLQGHTDAIMWASWSPDDKIIATACWDQHYRIWDAVTGECKHDIGPTDGQNWTGAFSPDGKSVLLSGGKPVKVAIYDVETGEEKCKLEQDGPKLDRWMRGVSWNPNDTDIALINGHSVILWSLFQNAVETLIKLKADTVLTGFNAWSGIKWADEGRKLLLQDSENTTFVWDRERNLKWRFQRPHGTALKGNCNALYVSSMQTVLALDGDGKVRFWKL